MFSFLETRLFTKLVVDYLSDDDYAALQEALMREPDSGSVIPGSGGIRKLRCAGLRQGVVSAAVIGLSITCAGRKG